MKQYPSIPFYHECKDDTHVQILAFNKEDGSNFRAEYDRKKGFWKFGTKTRLVGKDEYPFGEGIELVLNKYEDAMALVFEKLQVQKAIAFFEFLGPNSFCGVHASEPHDVILLEVDIPRKGFILPREFVKLFGHLHIPSVVYDGPFNQEFVENVKTSTLPGMAFEGVVCKGPKSKRYPGYPVMFKVKSDAWIARLRSLCKDDKEFEERK